MGVIIPEGESLAVMRWSVIGDPEVMHSTIGIRDTTTGDPDPEDVAARFALAYSASNLGLPANISSQYSRNTHLVTTRVPSGLITIEVGTGAVGTKVAVPLPNNCAILVRKNTALGGRRNRGRMYLPPAYLAETDVNQTGVIDPTVLGNVQTLVTALFDELATQDLSPVVQHENGGIGTVITSMIVQGRIATQRTRMRR